MRLLSRAIKVFDLDLAGIPVLTEAASGVFACTPLLAACAGAQTTAVTRDSRYGSAAEVGDFLRTLAAELGVSSRLSIHEGAAADVCAKAALPTNLGFVRPIDRSVVERLPADAAIALMWEGWEARAEDIDFAAAAACGVPIVGTNEDDERVKTLEYLGPLAVKLLFEAGIEVLCSRLLVVGSEPFGGRIAAALARFGAASVMHENPEQSAHIDAAMLAGLDAVVVAEHRSSALIIGSGGLLDPAQLAAAGVAVIHISGSTDDSALTAAGIRKVPARSVPPRHMTVTTAYCGPRPVVDLHTAGLKVGEIMVRARRGGADAAGAERAALASGLGSPLPGHLR
ncbi:MAG: hypothetical protein HKO62_10980 [Gammaproteobacteria bacterium]|nr:hypothetical protein [Gammaproteobacteria bacterium]